MNSTNLRHLLPAIVSRVVDRGSFVTKTKLLKILYLFDVEWYRTHRETYTGFDWKFYLLGPWTPEYDPLLDKYFANEFLDKETGRDAYDAEFITTKETVRLDTLFDSREDERILEDTIQAWATAPTAEILEHAYFRTEPMEQAARDTKLDFSNVSEQPPRRYRRTQSGLSKPQLNAIRKKITERLQKVREREQSLPTFIPPSYDDEFFEAMEQLEKLR